MAAKKPAKKTIWSNSIVSSESRGIAKEAYSKIFLDDICNKVGIQDKRERKKFSDMILYSGGRYLDLKRMNTGRIQPNRQDKLLDKYKKSLENARDCYLAVKKSSPASAKLEMAIRRKYEEISDAGMIQMFEPYCDRSGMATTLFGDFLGVLVEAVGNAKNQDIGADKGDLSKQFLTEWVVCIGKAWPKDASEKWVLGPYYSGQVKEYFSNSITVVYEIVRQIEARVTKKNIETIRRLISKKGLINQPVANFFSE